MAMDYITIRRFLYREARYLDDREWENWLTCYADNVEYWMPCWNDDDELIKDPQSEVSLIYYPDRRGLEDRIFRIQTERSSASTPEPRTTHMISNIEILDSRDNEVDVRYNFHTLSFRYRTTDHYFGTIFVTIVKDGDELKINKKKIVLKNDYIRQVIDIYHI
ncbi:benzoate 1,2-dioxygenase small subunit [Oligella urethralis]|uniref:benzoate 1,2-dioxygenase small subunit n=1 Tax=Oligella urethralis TaxID=90245 RepID=UPI000E0E51DC|nr:benzoate 1,2-dioxygenase small subunit [Oligella urethralis]